MALGIRLIVQIKAKDQLTSVVDTQDVAVELGKLFNQ